jgi:TIR domain
MAGGDSGAGTSAGHGREWDVALSFASAQRAYVEQVAAALRERGVRCFYDADEQIDLWGKYLAEELPAIYSERAATVVVFVSADYAARDWTRLERRAALNRAVRERREYVLPARFDDTQLPGLLSDLVAVDLRGRTAEQFAAMIAAKLAALGIPSAGSAENQARDAGTARPAGAVRAGEADLRRLGVHAAISVPGVPDEVPPEYVPRDTDAGEHGVRAKVAAAAERGGFILLVGGSSVGKTRCAAEAVKALLPDWWLVHPGGPAEVAALAAAPAVRTVVWLDELQHYLDGEGGLSGGVVRALLGAPGPVVIIGTLWPDRYAAYTALRGPGEADPHAREREVPGLAAVIRISEEFSPAEQDRARAPAARDPRVREALAAAGYGLTQTLAAAPQLVARWEDARTASPYAWAVLTAALDAARLGARAPLTAGFLRAAAVDYCTSAQQAEAPENWFEQALAYATGKLHGAAAALKPSRCRHGPGRRVHRGGLPGPARQPGPPLFPGARQHLGRRPQSPP